jgi:GNAT superfamily N-acetyltransferase
MPLVVAEGELLDRVFDLTFPTWHEGLTRHAYGQWNTAQMRTPWARDRFHRFALLDDAGHVLASLKRYRYDVRLDGHDGWMCGLGAVFTPPDQRGRGYASQLIEQVLAREQRDGALMATLFSEIGPALYVRLGFTAVPLDEYTVRVRRKAGAPAMLVRAGDERDLPDVAAMHVTRAVDARFALRRDPATIRFALARKRAFAGLSVPGTRQVEFFAAEEGSSAVAYLIVSMNQHGWTLEEAGDRDPAGARLGAMLQVLMAREPARETPLIRAWWPRGFVVPPQLELTDRSDARDLLMVRPLADVTMPTSADDVFYWYSDVF